MPKIIFTFFLISYTVSANVDLECLKWFQKSKLKQTDTSCLLKCTALPTDLNTFHCPNKCEELCGKISECNTDSFWRKKLKSGRPQKWDLNSEKSSEWSQSEKEQLTKILSRLPDELKKVPFDGIYRMQTSVAVINPATTSLMGTTVVIYDRAFNNPFWSFEDVVLHELGHVSYLYLNNAERLSFKDQMGWRQSLSGDSSREGDFVSSRAKDSPEEDFAESFLFFLKDPNFLKSKNIQAYEWLIKKYSVNFKYKKDCDNGKK